MIRNVAVTGGTVALTDEGPVRSGPSRRPRQRTVVLLHGFTGSKASWTHLRAALRPTCRVIAIDLPGHGGTVMDGARFDFSLACVAAVVLDALDALDVGRFALIGYSLGGRLALQIALAHRDRVARLVLESASAGLATATARARRRRADEALATFIESAGVAAFVRRWEALPLFRPLASLPRAARDRLRRQRLACTAGGLAASLRGMGTGAQPWLGDHLAALTMPVLAVTGARDRKFTRAGRELARRAPHGRHDVIGGAGHVPHLEQPARFVGAVRAFLAAAAPSRPLNRLKEETHADRLGEGSELRGHHVSARRRDRPHRDQSAGGAECVPAADGDGADRCLQPRA